MNNKYSKINCLFLNPAPSLIKYGMHWGMGKIGCNSYLFDYGETAIFDKSQEYQLQKIEEKIKGQKTNLIFCEGYSNMPTTEIRRLCKKYNIQFHWWDIESPVTPRIALSNLKNTDFMWSTCIEYINQFKNMGYKSDLLLFGCNPEFHGYRQPEKRFQHDISLVGTNYSNRFNKVKEFILPLLDNGFDLMIYGLWWMNKEAEVNLINYPNNYWNEHPALPYDWLPVVINSSKIMLGLNCSDASETQTTCRLYEILASSETSVYLAWYTKAQDKLFGDYIYQAKSGQEMLDMAKEILSMTDKQRNQKALLAREYVINNHSYELRAKQVADKFFELGGNI